MCWTWSPCLLHCTSRSVWPPQASTECCVGRYPFAALVPARNEQHDCGMNTVPVVTTSPVHRPTPTGRPSWYGTEIGREDRSVFSATGDVSLRAGNTFPTTFATLAAAVQHARAASAGDAGAVAVFGPRDRDAHRGVYWLARSYNVERTGGALELRQTHLTGREHVAQWHPEARLLIDGAVALGPVPGSWQ